jgi:single-strand DNA-binding protein
MGAGSPNVSPHYNPVSCSVTASGNTPIAPCGTASFCFPGALQNKFENDGKEHRSNFFRPAPKKALLGTWEHRPTSLISDPSKFGNSKRRHHHGNEPRNPHHAQTHTKNDRNFTTFSLATSTRFKNKDGKYTTLTEWHRCIVFGPRAEAAAKLEKGAHIEVRGAIRHTEYKGSKRDSIVVNSFLKLDRTQRVESDEQEHEEIPDEAMAE